jgi:hypothetical protein
MYSENRRVRFIEKFLAVFTAYTIMFTLGIGVAAALVYIMSMLPGIQGVLTVLALIAFGMALITAVSDD